MTQAKIIPFEKLCGRCKITKPAALFSRETKKSDGLHAFCKPCAQDALRKWCAANKEHVKAQAAARWKRDAAITAPRARAWQEQHKERVLWLSARLRAKTLGRPFFIAVEDVFIPTTCPLTDVVLMWRRTGKRGPSHDSPSLDCIIPSLGYVPGNVWVVSVYGNLLKGGASPELMRRVLAEVDRRGLEAKAA